FSSAVSHSTFIPSVTGVVQAVIILPFTFTVQTRQEPLGVIPSTWHNVGIKMPLAFAAARIEAPFSAVHSLPSIVNFTFSLIYLHLTVRVFCLRPRRIALPRLQD